MSLLLVEMVNLGVDVRQGSGIFPLMSTLAEIEEAAEQLPPSQMKELVSYLMGRLERFEDRKRSGSSHIRRKGFPVSRGRVPFGAAEAAEDLEGCFHFT